MGDATADLYAWKDSGHAITVNISASLRKHADTFETSVEHLQTAQPGINPYIKAIRPHQWLKNILVFIPAIAAHDLSAATLLQCLGAFIAFSLIASSVYVANDLLDLRADRAHPRKRERPFASGSVPIAHRGAMLAALIGAGAGVAALLGWPFVLAIAAYFIITTAYSLLLKRRVIIDICTLAALYTMRLVAGAIATGIPLSIWFLVFSIFFFSLAAIKRQAELIDNAARGKLQAAGRGYLVEDLPIVSIMSVASGYVSILVMALYINSPSVMMLYSEPLILVGVCGVLFYWISRIAILTHRGQMHDDPVVFAARDRPSQICLFLMICFVVGGAAL